MAQNEIIVGVISDTHGLIRPEALEVLQGANLIVHGGDIGDPEVLSALRAVAPVFAVRGNCDKGGWAEGLSLTDVVSIGDTLIYLLHDLQQLDLEPLKAGFGVVISGHSHQPKEIWKDNILYFNPGSAGPRRFNLPVSLGLLNIKGTELQVEIINLL